MTVWDTVLRSTYTPKKGDSVLSMRLTPKTMSSAAKETVKTPSIERDELLKRYHRLLRSSQRADDFEHSTAGTVHRYHMKEMDL